MAYTFTQLESLWISVGGPRAVAPIMAAIGLAESGGANIKQKGKPYAKTGWGIWQITPGNSEPQYGIDEALLNPYNNASAALAKYHSQGLGAWTTYTSGRYQKYMSNQKNVNSEFLRSPINPRNSKITQIDQGVDISSGSPFLAPDSGIIEYIDPNFYQGTPAVYEKLDYPVTVHGRKYDAVYFGETQSLVKPGQRVVAGQPVAAPGNAELGFAKLIGGSWLPAAHGHYTEGHPTVEGQDFDATLLQAVYTGTGDRVPLTSTTIANLKTGETTTTSGAGGGGLLSGIESFGYQVLFIIIGLGLILVGLGLIAWTVMGRVGAPGIIGMAQSQMRIRQAGQRIEAQQSAVRSRTELRTRSLSETERAAKVRESQAAARHEERVKARELSERRLDVHERGVQRREPRSRKFSDVKRDDRTVAKRKPGRKVSGPPKKK